MFLTCCFRTIPVALFGLIFLVDLPWNAKKSLVLTEEVRTGTICTLVKLTPSFALKDIALARARMKAVGRKGTEPWTKAKVCSHFSYTSSTSIADAFLQLKRILSTWYIWILPIEYVLWNNGSAQSPMQYWLKAFNPTPAPVPGVHWTTPQIQLRT